MFDTPHRYARLAAPDRPAVQSGRRWAGWSYLSLGRWRHRGEAHPHGLSRTLRLYVPLAVDLCSVVVIWIVVPAALRTPIAAIALFAPDVWAVAVTITGLTVGCVIARTFVALRPHRAIR